MNDSIKRTGANDDELLVAVRSWHPGVDMEWGASRAGVRDLLVNGTSIPIKQGAWLRPGVGGDAIVIEEEEPEDR